jgi:hypothetical protein
VRQLAAAFFYAQLASNFDESSLSAAASCRTSKAPSARNEPFTPYYLAFASDF